MNSNSGRLSVCEIFWSSQGEGDRYGFPSVFIRLSGCSLHCSYCDTSNSWQGGDSLELEHILSRVQCLMESYPHSQIVLTGGEPLEQDLTVLVQELKKKKYYLAIETNGLHFQELEIDWWTISPKDGNQYLIHPELLKQISEVKLIVNENLSLDVIRKVRSFGQTFPVFLQPDHFNSQKYKFTWDMYRKCQLNNIRNVRLGLQLHRVYEIE